MAFDKAKLRREIERARKEALRVRLAELRGLIKTARADRHAAIRGVQLDCKAKREQLRNTCALRRVEASELGLRGIERARHVFAHEQRDAKQIAQAGRPPKARSTAKERQQESDDAVRGNLAPEMLRVFDSVKRHIKGGPRKSRTEEFLEWAEENPGEVYTLQARAADRELAALLAEEARANKELRRRSAVPF